MFVPYTHYTKLSPAMSTPIICVLCPAAYILFPVLRTLKTNATDSFNAKELAVAKQISIVIEGIDGSGNGEQTALLVERLKKAGHEVALFDFPRYSEPSSYFVREYLAGNFGSLEEINPRTASLFFALDRYAAAKDIRKAIDEEKIVVFNRYVASNLAHQGCKIADAEERMEYFKWNYDLEYAVNGIPAPDCNIILFMPPKFAQKMVDKKAERGHLEGKKRDLHEADIAYLRATSKTYREIAKLYPNDFLCIECSRGDHVFSIREIHQKVWALVAPMLK